jgi:hypothetical protein
MIPQTLQELFKALVDQGGPSVTSSDLGTRCVYRGKHARKCAAGWLIPDEMYRPVFEGINIRSLVEREGRDILDPAWRDKVKIVLEAQNAHDSAQGVQERHGTAWVDALTREWDNRNLPR